MGYFLWLSDLHVDPLYGTEFAVSHHTSSTEYCTSKKNLVKYPYSRRGCDSSFALFDSCLDDILKNNNTSSKRKQQIDFILITGDLVRHGTDELYSSSVLSSSSGINTTASSLLSSALQVSSLGRGGQGRREKEADTNITKKDEDDEEEVLPVDVEDIDSGIDVDHGPISFTGSILSSSIHSIKKRFPNIPIIPVLGNNDVTPDYYLADNNDDGDDDTDEKGNTITTMMIGNSSSNSNFNVNDNELLEMARSGFSACFESDEEERTFLHGGYFSRIIQTTSTSSILILSINTIIYSTNHQPEFNSNNSKNHDEIDDNDDDPFGQFAWIESQLQKAINGTITPSTTKSTSNNTNNNNNNNNEKPTNINAIYVVGHIPFGIGSYRHSQFWFDRYVDRYIGILKQHNNKEQQHQQRQQYLSSTTTDKNKNNNSNNNNNNFPSIQGQLFGHMHTEEFRLLSFNDDGDNAGDSNNNDDDDKEEKETNNEDDVSSLTIPLFVTSSLTPVYGSNPSYRIVKYDNEWGALLDYSTHYLNLSSSRTDYDHNDDNNENSNNNWVWKKLPDFTVTYNVSDMSSKSLESIIQRFEKEREQQHEQQFDDLYQNDSNSNNNRNNNIIVDSCNNNNSTVASSLWDTFIARQHIYSSYEDNTYTGNNDDISNLYITIEWICTLRAVSKDDYLQCIYKQSSATPSSSSHGGIILYLTVSTVLIILSVVIVSTVFSSSTRRITRKKKKDANGNSNKKRIITQQHNRRSTHRGGVNGIIMKRRYYHRPTSSSSSLDGIEITTGIDNNNGNTFHQQDEEDDNNSNLSSNSATAGEFI